MDRNRHWKEQHALFSGICKPRVHLFNCGYPSSDECCIGVGAYMVWWNCGEWVLQFCPRKPSLQGRKNPYGNGLEAKGKKYDVLLRSGLVDVSWTD
mmetsp:Transcript_9777/g.9872  ORF Transcript_9777/g.9872 Transcript_9777/m.9872 type:complete len:96 (-) Transcript_9777:444-731(-)